MSVSTVWRWLDEDALKPWRHRSWIFARAPDFAAKAGIVLDLYQRRFGGERLGPDEFVISADEKTSIQARCRCHPTQPPADAQAMRVEHEYERGGALAYLAAWDVHRARLSGRCEPIDLPAQGADPQRLRRPWRGRPAPAWLAAPLPAEAVPFAWRFTRADLERLLRRLNAAERCAAAP